MPRFYFHLRSDFALDDSEGAVLPDLAAAQAEARRCIMGLAGEDLTLGSVNLNHRIEIADEDGRVLASVNFGDVFRVES